MAFLLGYHHYLVTGSPLSVPVFPGSDGEPFWAYKEGCLSIPIRRPKLDVIWQLLVGLPRGLVWYSPTLLGAIPGLRPVLVQQRRLLLAWMIVTTFLACFSSTRVFPAWEGGWATGPRFLVPAFPLLALATGVWLNHIRPNLG
ncbi:MAG: hypothetical protein U1D30_25215 [Planctomycetota bacterium]